MYIENKISKVPFRIVDVIRKTLTFHGA